MANYSGYQPRRKEEYGSAASRGRKAAAGDRWRTDPETAQHLMIIFVLALGGLAMILFTRCVDSYRPQPDEPPELPVIEEFASLPSLPPPPPSPPEDSSPEEMEEYLEQLREYIEEILGSEP